MNTDEKLTDSQIFNSIWLKPRNTFQNLIEENYQKWVLLLIILGGIAGVLENISSDEFGDHFPVWGVILIAVFGGVFFGWFGFYIFSLLLSWTGKWIGGNADLDKLLLVIAYAQIPVIITILIFILQLIFFGTSEFSFEELMDLSIGEKLFLFPLLLIEIILSIWSMVLAVIGVSEAQNFSIPKSILNLVLPTLVIVIPIMVVVLMFKAS